MKQNRIERDKGRGGRVEGGEWGGCGRILHE